MDIQEVRDILKFEYKDFFNNRRKIKSDINIENNKAMARLDEFQKQLLGFD